MHTGRGACTRQRTTAPLSSELRHHTAYPDQTGSHLGSTLKPGRAVLTLGVSRRSRSVAYIHADASPSEVHREPSWHSKQGESTQLPANCKNSVVFHGVVVNACRDALFAHLPSSGGWWPNHGHVESIPRPTSQVTSAVPHRRNPEGNRVRLRRPCQFRNEFSISPVLNQHSAEMSKHDREIGRFSGA